MSFSKGGGAITYSLLFEQKMILYLYKFEPFHSLSLSFSLSLSLTEMKIGLFVWCPNRDFFSYGYVTITDDWLQILTYIYMLDTLGLWAMSSEGSLACHIYWDMGHSIIMVTSEDPWHLHLLPSGWQWSCDYFLTT